MAPLPAGVTLTVLMDCCHSGTILDLPFCFDGRDGTLDAIDAGGKSVVEKKKKFNAQKVREVGEGSVLGLGLHVLASRHDVEKVVDMSNS